MTNNVLIFQDVQSDSDVFVEVPERILHEIISEECHLLSHSINVTDKTDTIKACRINDSVVQYLLDEDVWVKIEGAQDYISSRMYGYAKQEKFYLRRGICEEYAAMFKDGELAKKKRRLTL